MEAISIRKPCLTFFLSEIEFKARDRLILKDFEKLLLSNEVIFLRDLDNAQMNLKKRIFNKF